MEKEIFLVFSFTGTTLSRLIKKFTKDNYTHVSLCLNGNFQEMYSFGRKHPSNPIWAGFVTENLFDGVFKNFKNSRCLVYKITVKEEQYERLLEELCIFLNNSSKYKYNFLGLFTAKANRDFTRKYHYFCSQFVSELLLKSEILETSKSPSTIKPSELTEIKDKVFIFEGTVSDFSKFINKKNNSFNNDSHYSEVTT